MEYVENLKGLFGKTRVRKDELTDRFIDYFSNGISKRTIINHYCESGELALEVIIVRDHWGLEEVYIRPEIITNAHPLVTFQLRRYPDVDDNDNFRFKYYFDGNVFLARPCDVIITESQYKELKSKATQLCDPNHEFAFTEFIDILRLIDNSEIVDVVENWDKYVPAVLRDYQLLVVNINRKLI